METNSSDVVGLKLHGEMSFREISHSWTLGGQLKKQKWQLKTGPFGGFSQVRQQVQIMHDAFQLVSHIFSVLVVFLKYYSLFLQGNTLFL